MKTYIASLLVDDQTYTFTGSTKNATLSLSGNNKYPPATHRKAKR